MASAKPIRMILALVLSLLAITYSIVFAMVHSGLLSKIEETDATLFMVTGDGQVNPVDTLTIRNGSELYGWHAVIRTTQSDAIWEESLTLPSTRSNWNSRNLVRVSPDRETAYSSGHGKVIDWQAIGWTGLLERLCFVKTVSMQNIWRVVDEDPVGDYVFTVTIAGKSKTLTLHVRNE